MGHIFLSYNEKDRERAAKVAEALETLGFDVWWDPKIRPGAPYDETIDHALDEAAAVVVLWSATSVKSDWVKEEAKRGAERDILVPARIDEVSPPLGFGFLQTVSLVEWAGDLVDPEFGRLAAALREMVGLKPRDPRDGPLEPLGEREAAGDDRGEIRESGILEIPLELLEPPARYSLSDEIGSTARNRVYRGHDTKTGLSVAIKCPRAAASDRRALQRFDNEARLGMRVADHPSVCPVFDFRPPRFGALAGASPSLANLLGRIVPASRRTRQERLFATQKGLEAVAASHPPFLVMPFLEGELLSGDRGDRWPLGQCLPVLAQICAGLQHIHDRGIIFRDLKPENVMIQREGEGPPRALIFDFDLAIDVRSPEARGRALGEKLTIGTPAFMSPEQVRSSPLDQRSDIFQMGLLAHELLTGRLPFAGQTPEELMLARVKSEPAPLREHAPDLPDRLEAVILKCLASDPEQRFSTAAELGAAFSEPLE